MTVAQRGATSPTAERPEAAGISTPSRRGLTWISACSFAAISAALLVGVWLSRRNQWTPILDIAALELRVRGMQNDLPLVGVFSRMGWYHPGPAFIVQEWLPYQLFGVAGLAYGIVVLHLVALGLAWWLAARLDRVAGACVLLAGMVVLWARDPAQAMEPWNPWAGMIVTITLMAAAWSAGWRQWPGTVALLPIGSYLIQSHLGFVPLVGLLVVTAAAAALWPRRGRGPEGPAPSRVPWWAWLTSAAAALVLWLPPLYEQLTRSPGNATLIVESFGKEPTAGLTAGLVAVADGFAIPPYWLHYSLELPADTGFPWLLALPVAATGLALVRRDGLRLAALAVCWAATAAAVLAVANVSGQPAEYLVGWIPAVVVTTLALSLWVLAGLVPRRLRIPQWAAVVALQLAAVALAVATAANWASASQLYAGHGRAAAVLADAVAADAGGQPVELGVADVRSSELLDLRQVFYGVLAGAARAGTDIAGPQNIVWETTGAIPPDGTGRVRYELRSVTPGQPTPAGARLVARYDPFSAEQWQAIGALDEQLAAPGLSDDRRKALVEQRAQLLDGETAFEVVAVDPR